MNILVTIDSNYVFPLCIMLRSLIDTNKNHPVELYVAHSSLTDFDKSTINSELENTLVTAHYITLNDSLFENAPTKKRISKETYYRLFAPIYLPSSVERILYIDPDTIILNSLNQFYSSDFEGNLIIGAKHFDGLIDLWNRRRLFMKRSKKYINAGIMLLNIAQMRKRFTTGRVYEVIRKYSRILFLADQDAINIIYDGKIKTATEFKINLDERTFSHILKKCTLDEAMDFVKANTLIVHYNGKYKPWKNGYKGSLKCLWDKYNYIDAGKYKYGRVS